MSPNGKKKKGDKCRKKMERMDTYSLGVDIRSEDDIKQHKYTAVCCMCYESANLLYWRWYAQRLVLRQLQTLLNQMAKKVVTAAPSEPTAWVGITSVNFGKPVL
jgi:hypothetical protein